MVSNGTKIPEREQCDWVLQDMRKSKSGWTRLPPGMNRCELRDQSSHRKNWSDIADYDERQSNAKNSKFAPSGLDLNFIHIKWAGHSLVGTFPYHGKTASEHDSSQDWTKIFRGRGKSNVSSHVTFLRIHHKDSQCKKVCWAITKWIWTIGMKEIRIAKSDRTNNLNWRPPHADRFQCGIMGK
jgi:hypothetical protein